MPEQLTPDLCVIGAGAGGVAAAEAACGLGADVVVVDRGSRGATGRWAGPVAAAALHGVSRRAHAIRTAAAAGVAAGAPRVSFAGVRDYIHAALADAAPATSAAHLAAIGARVLHGAGRFRDARTLEVGDTLVRAHRFIIATGASPTLPAIAGLEGVPFFTAETVVENARPVSHLVIVGAGASGAELGQSFRRLGADVTLIEQHMPLAEADPELAVLALRRLQEEGVLIRTGTTVPGVAPREGGGVVVTIAADGVQDTISASHLLVATGRLPNLDLDLERADIRRSRRDPTRLELVGLRTTNRRVFAIGDAAGGIQTVQRATHDGRFAARAALLGTAGTYRPLDVPVVFNTDPAIAWIGLDEAAARDTFGDRFRVARLPFAENDRARALGETQGLIKLVTTPAGRILGAGIVGPGAGELVSVFSLALVGGLSIADLARMTPPYPAFADLVRAVAAETLRGRPPSPLERALRDLHRRLP